MKARGFITSKRGNVTRIYVMTVTETRRGATYEVFGLKDGEDFDTVAHNFAHYILDGEYLEIQTEKAVYKLWRVECL